MGFELEDEELQTTPRAAARELAGRRVLALVMPAIVPDLEGIELVGESADAVLLGGADETLEPNQVFSYMNLNRAFFELQAGAELYCLHKNRWWQTKRGPMLDAGAFVAGLEYACDHDATVLGKPSPSYFAAALEHLDAEPELTWLVTDDLEDDVRGAQLFGMRTVLVRTGKFRPEALERSDDRARHGAQLDRTVPGLARALAVRDRSRPDRDRADPPRARAARASASAASPQAERDVLRLEAEPRRELRRPVRRQGGGRQGARLRRALHVEGDRDRRPPEARRHALGQDGGVGRARAGRVRSTSR